MQFRKIKLPDIDLRTILNKVKQNKERSVIIISLIIASLSLIVFLIFYVPLIYQLRDGRIKSDATENEVLECRSIIESLGNGSRHLITEEDISQAIDELTKNGERKGINFISIEPSSTKKEKKYKILPIGMELESSYEALAVFMGSLDDLEKGLAKVIQFDIEPSDNDRNTLITTLTAEMYFSGN